MRIHPYFRYLSDHVIKWGGERKAEGNEAEKREEMEQRKGKRRNSEPKFLPSSLIGAVVFAWKELCHLPSYDCLFFEDMDFDVLSE